MPIPAEFCEEIEEALPYGRGWHVPRTGRALVQPSWAPILKHRHRKPAESYLDWKRVLEKGRKQVHRSKNDLALEFRRLADEWYRETAFTSSTTVMLMHPAYRQIVAMGPDVLPLIFIELRDNGGHWNLALADLTRQTVTVPEGPGRMKKIREAWLTYGKERGYL